MVTFRCKRSGNTVSFSLPADIDGLRKHEGYEEVKDESKAEGESSSSHSVEASRNDEGQGNEDGNEKARQEEVLVVKKRAGRPKNK